jgi:hypothetical protein
MTTAKEKAKRLGIYYDHYAPTYVADYHEGKVPQLKKTITKGEALGALANINAIIAPAVGGPQIYQKLKRGKKLTYKPNFTAGERPTGYLGKQFRGTRRKAKKYKYDKFGVKKKTRRTGGGGGGGRGARFAAFQAWRKANNWEQHRGPPPYFTKGNQELSSKEIWALYKRELGE